MSQRSGCENCRELLPLLYAKALSDTETAAIQEHLKECAECRAFLKGEAALFAEATVESPFSPLADHPTAESLDNYVYAKHRLSTAQVREVENHLSTCELCTELIAQLQKLPGDLDQLVDRGAIPLIRDLEEKPREKARIIEIGRRVFWQPLAGYAVAAAVLLVAVIFRQAPTPEGTATVSGILPVTTRGGEQATVFVSPSQQCLLELKYYVDPETGHQYDLEVKPERAGQPSYVIRDYKEFDPQGNAVIKVLLEIGKYQLLISDIEGSDTIKVVKPFELKVQP